MHIGKQSSCLTVETGERAGHQGKRPKKVYSTYDRRHHRKARNQVETVRVPTTTKGMTDVTTALAPTRPQWTCDRYGAQAYVRVCLISGGELLFCAHHGREHLPKLHDLATEIQDETERLQATATSASV